MPNDRILNDDELNEEIAQILPAADRLRLVALDRTKSFSAAKTRSLQRELRIVQTLTPDDSAQIAAATRRVELQQRFTTQTTAEIQRGEIAAPVRNPAALVLHGRVVDRNHLGQPGLVVSAIGDQGRALVFTCTDDNGYFRLDVPVARPDNQPGEVVVMLLVSNSQQAILYRGTEAFLVAGNKVIYREIVLGGEPAEPPCPPPPPVPERVTVPNVIGIERSRAIELLKRAGLLADEEKAEVEPEKVGLVMAQKPKAGTSVEAGSYVTITVGVGSETVTVPDVVRKTLAEALLLIKRSQLRVGSVEPPNPGDDAVVIAQSPKAGATVERGSFVDLKVRPRTVPPIVEVPNVVRLTLDEASATLAENKLKLGEVTTKPTSDNQVGLVLSQNPKAGTKAAPKSEVAVVIGGKERGGSSSQNPVEETIQLVAGEPDFEKVGASEAKLARIAAEEGLKTQAALRKFVETEEDAEVRDRFKLPNLDSARAFKEIVLRVIKRG
jgi:beta-lactam-binding protein with PASTA domain